MCMHPRDQSPMKRMNRCLIDFSIFLQDIQQSQFWFLWSIHAYKFHWNPSIFMLHTIQWILIFLYWLKKGIMHEREGRLPVVVGELTKACWLSSSWLAGSSWVCIIQALTLETGFFLVVKIRTLHIPTQTAMADVAPKILKQVEFYFSDSNLPFDKFLWTLKEKNSEGCKYNHIHTGWWRWCWTI